MIDKIDTYDENHCWQYDIRIKNYDSDVEKSGLQINEIESLKLKDIQIQNEEKSKVFYEVKGFIERHEWLGKMGLYPTYIFTARYKDILCGVLSFDMPNAFSKMLGEDTKTMERLIARGACISWSPKNLASKMIGYSIKWMVENTQYRLFTAYSDVEARELGTIYQACNFYYLGQKSGTGFQYKIRPDKWVSDRYFRSRSVYKKLALQNGIIWNKDWQLRDRVFFDKMPTEIAFKIKKLSKDFQLSCEKRKMIPKHKYAYVQGKNKRETKALRKLFESRNKTFPYPKQRGLII